MKILLALIFLFITVPTFAQKVRITSMRVLCAEKTYKEQGVSHWYVDTANVRTYQDTVKCYPVHVVSFDNDNNEPPVMQQGYAVVSPNLCYFLRLEEEERRSDLYGNFLKVYGRSYTKSTNPSIFVIDFWTQLRNFSFEVIPYGDEELAASCIKEFSFSIDKVTLIKENNNGSYLFNVDVNPLVDMVNNPSVLATVTLQCYFDTKKIATTFQINKTTYSIEDSSPLTPIFLEKVKPLLSKEPSHK